jgi:hypothetical protein
LIAGDLDRHVGRGRVALCQQCLGGGIGHADQDQKRDHGPDQLDRGVLVEVGGLVAHRLAVVHDGIEHRAEHTDEDHHADQQYDRVQIVDGMPQRSVLVLQVQPHLSRRGTCPERDRNSRP